MRRERLVKRRVMLGYSQEKLAELTGVDVSTVARWEQGLTEPRPYLRRSLAAVLEVSVQELEALLQASEGFQAFDPGGSVGARETQQSGLAECGTAGEGLEVNRRAFLLGTAGIAVGVKPSGVWGSPLPPDTGAASPLTAKAALDLEVVCEHLDEAWHSLVRADNLFGPRAALPGVLTNLALIERALPDLAGQARTALARWAAQFAESAAWLCEDLGEITTAEHWALQAGGWAVEATDPALESWILVGRARRSAYRREAGGAIALARAAQRAGSALSPAMRAAALAEEAEGHALAGEERTCHARLDEAERWAERVEEDARGDARGGHGALCIPSYIAGRRARCWTLLGKPARAVPLFDYSLSGQPAAYHRDRAWVLAGLARAYAEVGDMDEAAASAHRALDIALPTESGRTKRAIHEAAARLAANGGDTGHRLAAELTTTGLR